MFILLVVILTFISIALKLSASSLELANRVHTRNKRKNEDKNMVDKTVSLSMSVSAKALRVASIIVGLARNFMAWIGSFVIIIDLVVLVAVLMGSTVTLFTHIEEDGSLKYSIESSVDDKDKSEDVEEEQ